MALDFVFHHLRRHWCCFLFFKLLFALCYVPLVISQQPTTPAGSAALPSDSCNGVFLSYAYTGGARLPPNVSDPSRQPYRFESTLTVLNHDLNELKSWRVFVGFQHKEFLVSASNAVLADGTSLPGSVDNGTTFAGFPTSDLKSAIETAGDQTQMQVQVKLIGTQFGVAPPRAPMPSNITLANDGWLCPAPTMSAGNNETSVCCLKNKNVISNITVDDTYLPRQNGDLSIMYDVTSTDDSSYFAQVSIENHNPLGRLDYWQLSWDWMRDEFIYSMKGASTSVKDSSDCIFGPQSSFYQKVDFSQVLNCNRRPTIIDLPPNLANDTNFGRIPSCCRNGTILPSTMDPSRSISKFQMQVFKMPPDLNRSILTPPQNWRINGSLNPDYTCGPPMRVSPSQFPDPTGLPVNATAIASWQVVCNISQSKTATPKCCVSFSAYYNDSVIPCNTCACGCPKNIAQTCSATTPPMLLPPAALLVPFENRTAMAVSWAEDTKHIPVPKPMPCGDNCGVTINWHVLSDYRGGWSARITLFNWEESNFVDWFAAIEMDKAAPGFEELYSFNGSTLQSVNNTIFMQGKPGLNYLVAETDGPNPLRDPRVPGKQQSVLSFTKKNTPGISVVAGDGFPKKVIFNGEECSLPSIYPSSGSGRQSAWVLSIVLTLLVFIFIRH